AVIAWNNNTVNISCFDLPVVYLGTMSSLLSPSNFNQNSSVLPSSLPKTSLHDSPSPSHSITVSKDLISSSCNMSTPYSEPRPPVTRRESERCMRLLDLLSPPLPKKILPSPPTSTPPRLSPVAPRKKKSVIFTDKFLSSAKSVPNHRSCRRLTVGAVSHQPNLQSNHSLQPPLFSSRPSADHHKRARLSLATPLPNQSLISQQPSATSTHNTRLATLHSPLSIKLDSKQRLAQFYYTPSSHELSPRPTSPTLSTSAGMKQNSRPGPLKMLTNENDNDLIPSDNSIDSDDEIALSLLPCNQRSNSTRLDQLGGDIRRVASCPRFDQLHSLQADQATEDLDEIRPILKKTDCTILLADTVEQATRKNGRQKLSLDPIAPSVRRRVIAAVTSKALATTNSGSSPSSVQKSPQNLVCSTIPQSSQTNSKDIEPSHHTRSKDNLPLFSDSSDHSSFQLIQNSASDTETCLMASVKSCLETLKASLLPPPSEMRLDPVSPLATLTSPQKRKAGQLGNLDFSPREPRDVLPRPSFHQSFDSISLKSHSRSRGRLSGKSRTRSTESRSKNISTSVISTPLRTPDSSPKRQSQHFPRVAITLREVEDAYISLHDHLDALHYHWHETNQTDTLNQETVSASLFTEDLAVGLLKCLVREVENLCKLDPLNSDQQPPLSTNKTVPTIVRDDLSRMIANSHNSPLNSKLNSLRSHSTSSLPPKDKFGSSTNEIRRRVAEIETGQAALKCIALLWSSPSCMRHFDETFTRRLLSLVVTIPESSILRRKKNLNAVVLHNYIFKLQRLPSSILEPYCESIVDSISSTLYLSAGKSGDKGQKVLSFGLEALHQLTIQVPHQISQRVGRFLEPLLASLTATDSPLLRHHALRGLGALINCVKQDWDLTPRFLSRLQVDQTCVLMDDLKTEQSKKEALKDKLSATTFVYFNDRSSHTRWHLFNKQIHVCLNQGDFGWVISVMATMIALLGRRVRKLEPPLTRSFLPFIKILLQKEGPIKHLAQQLWDYFIHVMLLWSADSIESQHGDEVWALEKYQLPFCMQIFRNSYFFSPQATQNLNPATSVSSNKLNVSNAYEGLLQPQASLNKPSSVTVQLGNSPSASDLGQRKGLSGQECRSRTLIECQQSTHHLSLTAFLYGNLGFVKQYLAIPTPLLSDSLSVQRMPPIEWFETVSNSPRFRHLDVIWDELVEPFLPNILTGPVDEHRLYALDVLVSLCSNGTVDSLATTSNQTKWSLQRFLHPVYHDPPSKADSPLEICLDGFSKAAISSAVKPGEIPGMDPLWICFRSKKVLSMIGCSIASLQHASDFEKRDWLPSTEGDFGTASEARILIVGVTKVWSACVKAFNFAYQSWSVILESKFSKSYRNLIIKLEETLEYDRGFVVENEAQFSQRQNGFSIKLFQSFYMILKHELGTELLSRPLISVTEGGNDTQELKISGLTKLSAFLLTGSIAKAMACFAGPEDWDQYKSIVSIVVTDLISSKRGYGFPERLYEIVHELSKLAEACQNNRLVLLLGGISINVVIDLMKNVEPGVGFDESPLTPPSVTMIAACLNATHSEAVIDKATHIDFIQTFIRLLSRSCKETFKTLLDGCRSSLQAYLADHGCLQRDQLYRALLLKLQSANLASLIQKYDLADLIISPFKGIVSHKSSADGCLTLFLDFIDIAAVKAYVGQEQGVSQMADIIRNTVPSINPQAKPNSQHSSSGPSSPAESQCALSPADVSVQVSRGPNSTTSQQNSVNNNVELSDQRISFKSDKLKLPPSEKFPHLNAAPLIRSTRSQSRRSLTSQSQSLVSTQSPQHSTCVQRKLTDVPNVTKKDENLLIELTPSVANLCETSSKSNSAPSNVTSTSIIELSAEPEVEASHDLQMSPETKSFGTPSTDVSVKRQRLKFKSPASEKNTTTNNETFTKLLEINNSVNSPLSSTSNLNGQRTSQPTREQSNQGDERNSHVDKAVTDLGSFATSPLTTPHRTSGSTPPALPILNSQPNLSRQTNLTPLGLCVATSSQTSSTSVIKPTTTITPRRLKLYFGGERNAQKMKALRISDQHVDESRVCPAASKEANIPTVAKAAALQSMPNCTSSTLSDRMPETLNHDDSQLDPFLRVGSTSCNSSINLSSFLPNRFVSDPDLSLQASRSTNTKTMGEGGNQTISNLYLPPTTSTEAPHLQELSFNSKVAPLLVVVLPQTSHPIGYGLDPNLLELERSSITTLESLTQAIQNPHLGSISQTFACATDQGALASSSTGQPTCFANQNKSTLGTNSSLEPVEGEACHATQSCMTLHQSDSSHCVSDQNGSPGQNTSIFIDPFLLSLNKTTQLIQLPMTTMIGIQTATADKSSAALTSTEYPVMSSSVQLKATEDELNENEKDSSPIIARPLDCLHSSPTVFHDAHSAHSSQVVSAVEENSLLPQEQRSSNVTRYTEQSKRKRRRSGIAVRPVVHTGKLRQIPSHVSLTSHLSKNVQSIDSAPPSERSLPCSSPHLELTNSDVSKSSSNVDGVPIAQAANLSDSPPRKKLRRSGRLDSSMAFTTIESDASQDLAEAGLSSDSNRPAARVNRPSFPSPQAPSLRDAPSAMRLTRSALSSDQSSNVSPSTQDIHIQMETLSSTQVGLINRVSSDILSRRLRAIRTAPRRFPSSERLSN
ncbi:hypothetical protein O181_017989, partial [Austropuccinia psidii MF-1]|nr:hypothetical protein [Austropuccinia psidii MF-1]